MEKAKGLFDWFAPTAAMADRGYGAASNHEYLHQKGILPIIHIKRNPKGSLIDGIYSEQGILLPASVKSRWGTSGATRRRGACTRCKRCHLAGSLRGGVRHCDTEVWRTLAGTSGCSARSVGTALSRSATTPSNRAGVQEHEGVETAGETLHPGATADYPPRPYVGAGLSSNCAGQGAGRGSGGYAPDGQEGGVGSGRADNLDK